MWIMRDKGGGAFWSRCLDMMFDIDRMIRFMDLVSVIIDR